MIIDIKSLQINVISNVTSSNLIIKNKYAFAFVRVNMGIPLSEKQIG